MGRKDLEKPDNVLATIGELSSKDGDTSKQGVSNDKTENGK